MKYSVLIRAVTTASFFLNFCGLQTYAQNITLSADNADWTAVTGGEAVCEPVRTSYGFVVLTDGKMLSACTENGKKIWEKPVPGRPETYISVVSNDFLATVSDSRTLNLVNPSGIVLWSAKTGFPISEQALAGKDSRIFVRGRRNIACYGINGICKWSIQTPLLSQIPLSQLNDGTILAVLAAAENGKSCGIRITPFGDVVETINFAGIISNVMTSSSGVLLSFSSGGMGLCSVVQEKTQTKWAVPSDDHAFQSSVPSQGSRFVSINSTTSALLLANSSSYTKIIFFENSTGSIKNIFHADRTEYKNITCVSGAADGSAIFISDRKNGFIYDISGQPLWSAALPGSSSRTGNWNYIFYTKNNFIVICSKSWVMNGFRTIQRVSSKKSDVRTGQNSRDGKNPRRYENFYRIDTSVFDTYIYSDKLNEELTDNKRLQLIQKGNYGAQETVFASEILSANKAYSQFLASSYSGARQDQKSVFLRDRIGLQSLIRQLSILGTDDVPELLASMIRTERNYENFTVLVSAAGICGYDPDGKMLSAIQSQLHTLPASNTAALKAVSDAVYQICRFMGRPAFYSHCMEIQRTLLSVQYSGDVHQTVRNNLEKTAALKM